MKEFKEYARRLICLSKQASLSEKNFVANNLINVVSKLIEYKIIKNVDVDTIKKKFKSQAPVVAVLNDIDKLLSGLSLLE